MFILWTMFIYMHLHIQLYVHRFIYMNTYDTYTSKISLIFDCKMHHVMGTISQMLLSAHFILTSTCGMSCLSLSRSLSLSLIFDRFQAKCVYSFKSNIIGAIEAKNILAYALYRHLAKGVTDGRKRGRTRGERRKE